MVGDLGHLLSGLAAVLAFAHSVRTRRSGRSRTLRLENALHASKKDHRECRDRLSALETEMVTIRKLLPGGEWWRILRLDRHPYDDREER